MNKLYVISKFANCPIMKFNEVNVIEENEKEMFLSDKIEGKNSFLKENLDKEFEFLFVTKSKRKLRKQLKRIYNNIENNTKDEISFLNYKIKKIKELQKRNSQSYKSSLNFIDKKY